MLAVLAVVIASEWKATKLFFTTMLHQDENAVGLAIVIGVPLLMLSILPIALTGASVGEHLCQWRRGRFAPPAGL